MQSVASLGDHPEFTSLRAGGGVEVLGGGGQSENVLGFGTGSNLQRHGELE